MESKWWHRTEEPGGILCDLCPRHCKLKPGDRGFCFVRENQDGAMVLNTYGRSTGFCIDPIEKKPLNHFYPGTSVLSFGTAGCNLGCKFCQNHDISKAREVALLSEEASPLAIALTAQRLGCQSVACTYNDPIVWAEYAIDTARACRDMGIKSVAVTAGYITAEARPEFFEFFDAANVDLKAFTEAFYERVTLSHLQPVLDTLEWLQRESHVWFEITNLIIPDLNDSPDELRRLCDWVLQHVGDEVPLHFSAFHPDFKMLDRPQTPPETLLMAYDIARQQGLRFVYVGNIHDVPHQSTYCAGCGLLLIERDWYQLGPYALQGNTCPKCQTVLPGRFSTGPGDWGRRRLPVKISAVPAHGSEVNLFRLPELNETERRAIHEGASACVAAATTGIPMGESDLSRVEVREQAVMGVYVSLKRDGQLRGCCGFTGKQTNLLTGIRYAAEQTANHDPRMPPLSPTELEFLQLEVWLLGDLIPIRTHGNDRIAEVQIGRDGLVIRRGEQRGLLLPGVATDHGLDALAFLQQVCLKAKLPLHAWSDPATELHRFEGISIRGGFPSAIAEQAVTATQHSGVVSASLIPHYLAFCQENVRLILQGSLPNYYLDGVADGMVHGVVLMARSSSGDVLQIPRISLRPQIPLQSTLFSVSQAMAEAMSTANLNPYDWQFDLILVEDPAMHGTSGRPDLRGIDPQQRALLGTDAMKSSWCFDPSRTPQQLYGRVIQLLGLREQESIALFSFRTTSSRSPIEASTCPQPQPGPLRRPPAVAGKFYPATAGGLASTVRTLMPAAPRSQHPWRAAMVPHAGLAYSGKLAADVLSRITIPETVLILAPKHTRLGVDWAIAPHQFWDMPGFNVPNDLNLARLLADGVRHLQWDAGAHKNEHAIEVELPLLHHLAPHAKVAGIAIGTGTWESCQQFAADLAQTLRRHEKPVLLLISSDMNHFADEAETRRRDELALQAMESRDAKGLLQIVRDENISMCGVLPAVIVLETLRLLRPFENLQVQRIERVGYATSGDVTGDRSRVVGYAGMLLD